jgi:hypothetical protein
MKVIVHDQQDEDICRSSTTDNISTAAVWPDCTSRLFWPLPTCITLGQLGFLCRLRFRLVLVLPICHRQG